MDARINPCVLRPSISPCPSSPTFSTNMWVGVGEQADAAVLYFSPFIHSSIHPFPPQSAVGREGLLVIDGYLLTVTTNNSIPLWEQ